MRRSGLERSLVLAVLIRFLPAAVLGGLVLAAARRVGGLDAVATAALGALLLTAATAGAVWLAARPLARSLRELTLGAELVATVNPGHRLARPAPAELAALAEQIDRLADRLAAGRGALEAQVAAATAALTAERARLTAVLETLGEGVVVLTPEGVVTLANPEAHRLLGTAGGGLLGRNLFDLVDREKVTSFLDRLRVRAGGTEHFTLHPGGGVVLKTVMTPYFDGAGRLVGVVLVLHDVTRAARAEDERRRVLAEALRRVRGPLASIRSLAESLLGEPRLAAEPEHRLLAAVHAEAVRLAEVVERMGEPGGLGGAPAWHLESVTVAELAAVTVRRLAPDGHPAAVEVDASPALPPLRAEVSALSAALARLVGALLASSRPGGRPSLRARELGRVLQLDATAEGTARVEELEGVLDAAVAVPPGEPGTVREIVQRHGGEVWAWRDGERAGFSIVLPAGGRLDPSGGAPAAPGFVGAGLRSGAAPTTGAPGRPDFYDFSLFERMERAIPADLRERRLDELVLVAFDVETTGLHPEAGDRVVSLAGVRVRRGAVRRGETFDALVNPRRPIPAASARFHGITDRAVAGAPPIDVVLPAFLRFAEGAVLVGHQVWFDVKVLDHEAARLGLAPVALARPVLDTATLSEVVHGTVGDHGLEAVAARLGVAIVGRHSALGDALATAEIFVRLVELLRVRGIVTLGQALDASHERGRARAGEVTPGAAP